MKNFLIKIKCIRKSKSLSQTDLANKIKTSQQQLSRYENGTRQIPVDKLVEIAIALDVDLNDLIEIKQKQKIITKKMKEL